MDCLAPGYRGRPSCCLCSKIKSLIQLNPRDSQDQGSQDSSIACDPLLQVFNLSKILFITGCDGDDGDKHLKLHVCMFEYFENLLDEPA